jgi:hypothetical protein
MNHALGVQEAGSDLFALNWVSMSTRQLIFLGGLHTYLLFIRTRTYTIIQQRAARETRRCDFSKGTAAKWSAFTHG